MIFIIGCDLPDFTPREIETYSIDQLQKIFFACTAEENVTFQFFLHTGARDQEVRHTIWSHIDFDLGIVRITPKMKTRFRAWKFQPKGKAVRSIPVPDSLLKILRAREKTATGELVLRSQAHWKSPQARPRRKTDRSLPRNVQKRGPPPPAELRTVRGPRSWSASRALSSPTPRTGGSIATSFGPASIRTTARPPNSCR